MRFWIRFVFELVVTLGGSLGVFLLTGPRLYGFVGALMMAVMLGLVFNTRSRQRPHEENPPYDLLLEDHATPIHIRVLLGIGWTLLIGLFWPVLPIVIAWKRINDDVDAPPRSAERP